MEAFGVSIILLVATILLWRLVSALYFRPRALLAQLNKQGIYGPPPKLIGGNVHQILSMRRAVINHDMKAFTHNIVHRVMPDFVQMSKQYGKRHVIWWGLEPRILITEPELVREILSKKTFEFSKSKSQVSSISMLLGRGLVAVIGDEWAHHRRVVAPAFHLEKLKTMISAMISCTSSMLDEWESRTEQKQEVEACEEMSKLTADIISHTAFGSSYRSGQKVFEILRTKRPDREQASKFLALSWIPGLRYLPFPTNFRLRKLHREIDTTITSIIDERRTSVRESKCSSYGNDLLGLMLKECEGDNTFTYRDLIDECKTFYFAGHETTARLLSWSLMLLGGYTEWQERARAEILEVCGDGIPDGDSLSKLRLVGMVLYETLRLYPSVQLMNRACFKDTWVKDVFVPKGAGVTIPIVAIQHDKELWGDDADEFNPERFRDGITSACKHPNAFMPFSFGPRVCVGQSFALIEAKVALALILQRFSFRLSPNYRHNPATGILGFKPVHGVQLILTKRI